MEINIHDLFSLLMKKIWVILSVGIIAVIIAVLITSLFITPMYSSSVKVWAKTGDDVSQYQEALTIQYRIQTYSEFFTVPITLEKVSERLNEVADEIGDDGLRYSAKELQSMISVSISEGSEFITIHVKNANPAYAQLIANVVAESGKDVLDVKSVGIVEIVGKAELPSSPSSPSVVSNALIAFVLGVLATAAVIFIVSYFDTSIKSENEIMSLVNKPIIGTVPTIEVLISSKR